MAEKVRFIRKHGKIIPIREKKSGGVDQRHVSKKMLAKQASKLRPSKSGMLFGSVLGGLAGGVLGASRGRGFLGAAIGSFIGMSVGGTRVLGKQMAASNLRKKALRKFPQGSSV